MSKSKILWLLAIVITILTAYYQRKTGPTYPTSGSDQLSGTLIEYRLFRSHGGPEDHKIEINSQLDSLKGKVLWKRYKTNDEWTLVEMSKTDSTVFAFLPHQPPAGKLMYKILLQNGEDKISLNNGVPTVIRFKGDVPTWILIPHVIIMFLAMLYSNRTGLEFFNKEKKLKKLTLWTTGLLLVGGFIFGPIMQEYAFGELWTGFPFGYDLTDNKTLIAFVGWLIALLMLSRSKKPERWTLFAALLLFITYMIPHSVLGSEIDYSKVDAEKTKIENTIE